MAVRKSMRNEKELVGVGAVRSRWTAAVLLLLWVVQDTRGVPWGGAINQ